MDSQRSNSCKRSLSESKYFCISESQLKCTTPFCGHLWSWMFALSLRVIGLPGEEDWPTESPVCYSPSWAEKKPTKQLLPSLAHEENDLLSVSVTHPIWIESSMTGTQNTHFPFHTAIFDFQSSSSHLGLQSFGPPFPGRPQQ